jgi:hypothetical protein
MQPQHNGDNQDSFEQHFRRMKEFRMIHDSLKTNKSPETHTEAEPVPDNLLPALAKFGYVLDIICERGTLLLPRNWQN